MSPFPAYPAPAVPIARYSPDNFHPRRTIRFIRAIQLLILLAFASLASAQDVTTWHYDNARSGVQSAEQVLTPSNVNFATFGKLFSLPVIGDIYAQPLYCTST